MDHNDLAWTEAGARVPAPSGETPGGPARRLAELEAENAALRRALAAGGGGREERLRLLEAAPNPCLLLRPDPPRFTILGATDAYLAATSTRRDEIVGRPLFEAFPDNPGDPAATGARDLRASLERALATRAPDRMAPQRYDIRRREGDGGGFEERRWSPLNTPVPGPGGGVDLIIHHVEEVTEAAPPRERAAAGRGEAREPPRAPRAGATEAETPRGAREAARADAELRAANAALRESERRFRALVEASSDVLYRMSPDWAEMRQLSGGGFVADTPEPTRGWLADYIHPDDRPLVRAAIEDAVRRKGVFELEHRVRRPDGTLGWTSSRAVPILGADGGIAEWFGAARDVTARKAAEAALREGEARWRGLFERMQEGLSLAEMVYGPDGQAVDYRFLEVNAAWVRQTGIPREAAVGRLISEVVAPDERDFWVEAYARVAETGEPEHAERHIPSLRRWFEVVMHRAGPGRVAALVLDATERRRAEARRDALVELGDRLRDLRDPDGIGHAAAEAVGKALGALRAGYARVDADEDGIRIERDWTGGPAVAGIAGSHRLSDYWTGLLDGLRRGEVVAIGDVARHPQTAPRLASFAALGIRSCVHVPLVEAGRLAALLYVHAGEARDWTGEEVAFVRGAAERAWAAAERARAEGELRAANEALRAEGARLRLALEAGRLGAWELDVATGGAPVRSSRHDAIFGYAEGPPLEWGLEPFMRHVVPEDRAAVERSFRAAVEGGAEWHFECRVRRAGDGEVRWIEARGQHVRDAAGRRVRLLGVVQDVTDRKRAEERRALLVNELNHRVKNTLAVVQSLAAQTARGAADLPAFAAAFRARLMALARAHDLLTRKDWEGAPLGDVVRAAVQAGGEGRVDIGCGGCGDAGAPLLAPAQALAVAMALHELVTNAIKHGALSVPGGRVSVQCRADPGSGARVVEWAERGGPPVAPAPARRGFGLRLLERGLAMQAGVAAELRFEPGGLRCALRLPPAG